MVISIFLLTKFIKYLVNQIVFFGWLVYDLFSHIPFFSFRYLHQSETIQQITHRAKPNVHRFWGNFVSFPPPTDLFIWERIMAKGEGLPVRRSVQLHICRSGSWSMNRIEFSWK